MSDNIGGGEFAAIPQWTELGQDSGLDPLAMVRPTEALFQSLVPGISTITLRFRYFSFFAWMLEQYAERYGDTSKETFTRFQRRAEALYALIGVAGEYQNGLTGAIWASRAMATGEPVIEFATAADPDAETRYIKNKSGAYGAIYSTQMKSMGLVAIEAAQFHDLDILTERGRALAQAFDSSVASVSDLFLERVERGSVGRDELDALSPFKPNMVSDGSREQSLLQSLLVGGSGEEGDEDISRKLTMRQLLQLTELEGRRISPEDAKWNWYLAGSGDGVADDTIEDRQVRLWRLYHTNDLLRLSYEGLLKCALDTLAAMPRRKSSLSALADHLSSSSEVFERRWIDFQNDVSGDLADLPERAFADAIEAKGDPDTITDSVTLEASVSLLAVVIQRAKTIERLISEVLPPQGHFRSLNSELNFLETLEHLRVADVLKKVLSDRVIRRHLWVGARKFRTQKAYTYLAEVEEGRLKHRSSFTASLSNPRLNEALTFLVDAGLLEADGITDDGRKVLA